MKKYHCMLYYLLGYRGHDDEINHKINQQVLRFPLLFMCLLGGDSFAPPALSMFSKCFAHHLEVTTRTVDRKLERAANARLRVSAGLSARASSGPRVGYTLGS